MKQTFRPGDRKIFTTKVTKDDVASFNGEEVHPVYSTFSLGRDAEWACRLFVLEMKDEQEEGIGTQLQITHVAPAIVGSEIAIVAEIQDIQNNTIVCSFEVFHKDRLIATGSQTQKILQKEKIRMMIQTLPE